MRTSKDDRSVLVAVTSQAQSRHMVRERMCFIDLVFMLIVSNTFSIFLSKSYVMLFFSRATTCTRT